MTSGALLDPGVLLGPSRKAVGLVRWEVYLVGLQKWLPTSVFCVQAPRERCGSGG